MSLPVTQHFALQEFQSHDGVAYPSEWITERLMPLCQVLEKIREACGGRRVTILSGFRSHAHNQAVGGASKSMHMEGKAADITVDGMAPSDVHAKTLELYREAKIAIGGLGKYSGWVHVDIREQHPVGHLAQWTGSKIGDEVA